MKKYCVFLAVLVLVVSMMGGAEAYNTFWRNRNVDIAAHSIQTESKSITTGAGLFYGIIVRTDGSNDVTLNVYDAKTATGTRLTPANIVIDGTTFVSGWSYALDPAITYTSGVYVDVSVAGGGACTYDVLYFTLP